MQFLSDIFERALAGQTLGSIVFVTLAAFTAGLARGFSGFGGALIFVPLAASAMGPKLASPLYLIIDGFLSLGMLPNGLKRANRPEVYTMALGALIGIPLGTLILAVTPALPLRWIICLVVAGLLALLASGWRYHGKPRTPLTIGVGGLAGLFSGIAQMSGPPVVAYWLGGSIPAATARANFIVFFAITSVIAFASYLIGGLLTEQVFLMALLAGPGYGVGMYLGTKLFGVASEQSFRKICFLLIGIAVLIGLPLFDGMRP